MSYRLGCAPQAAPGSRAVQPRAWESLSRLPPPGPLSGIWALLSREPGPRHPDRCSLDSRSSGSAPAKLAPHFLGGNYSLCALPEPAQGSLPAPLAGFGLLWAPWRRRRAARISELGSCGLRGGAGGGGPRGAADPSAAFRSPPGAAASSRCLGAARGEGRAGAGDGGCYPRKGPRNPGSRQEGRPTLRTALWLLEHRAGGSQPCFRCGKRPRRAALRSNHPRPVY